MYDKVSGLAGSERRAELIKLAKSEGGKLMVDTTLDPDQFKPLQKAFQDDTGIKVDFYSASGSTMIQKVLQQKEAHAVDADVIECGLAELSEVNDLLSTIDSPVLNDIQLVSKTKDWAALYIVPEVVMWNTQRVPQDKAPKTWKDVFTNFSGEMVQDTADWSRLATWVSYLQSQGMTKDAAIDLIRKGVKGAKVTSDHTQSAQLVARGEAAINPVTLVQFIPPLLSKHAPIAYQPIVQPVLYGPVSTSILNTSKHPAAALLFLEYSLTDGQPVFVKQHRVPGNKTYKSEFSTAGLKMERILTAADMSANDVKEWKRLWKEMLGA